MASGNAEEQHILSPQEVRGLRVFITRGQGVTCHNGPQLTDQAFHNTGVPSVGAAPDKGRIDGVQKLLRDEFNCLGPYSDAKPGQCSELEFLVGDDKGQLGSFRTPGLRNVALRSPYMHAGQFGSLEQVLRHYMRAPAAATGRSEITAKSTRSPDRIVIRLNESDVADLTAFLGTLTGAALNLRECGGGGLSILNANERNQHLLTSLGLDHILDIDMDGTSWETERRTVCRELAQCEGQTAPVCKEEQARQVLHAHQALTEANTANVCKFRDVIQFLEDELAVVPTAKSATAA